MDGDRNQKWLELLRDYMIDNHINHTFWCLNTNSGDTGGLWTSFGFSPGTGSTIEWDAEKYGLFEESLWQTNTSGKYIGLDHEVPLGINGTGITVTDYYANYASSEGSNLDSDGSVKPQDPITPSDNPTEDTTGNTETGFISGDVTSDKKINVFDSVALRRMISAPLPDVVAASAADVTGDGTIGVSDLTLLNKFLLGKEVEFKTYK